jgi:eukaryotic-like serine/threonine-protein kinase
MHAACIFHRDLKPENLMLTKDGLVKILDFGLAKQGIVSNEVSETVTATGSVGLQGTVGYMSPEQARGQDVDYRADQFSFGCILYEMVSGRRAFSRGTAVETLSAIINEDPPAISHQELPQRLSWIIQRCLSKNREDRYESTKSLASDLQRLRNHVNFSAQKAVNASLNKRRQRVVSLLATGGLTLLLPLLVWLNVGGIRNVVFGPTASKRIPSPAVLPLDNLSKDTAEDFLRTV